MSFILLCYPDPSASFQAYLFILKVAIAQACLSSWRPSTAKIDPIVCSICPTCPMLISRRRDSSPLTVLHRLLTGCRYKGLSSTPFYMREEPKKRKQHHLFHTWATAPAGQKLNMGDQGNVAQEGAVAAENSPFPLTDLDRRVLSQTDEEYVKHGWQDLKRVIGELVYFESV